MPYYLVTQTSLVEGEDEVEAARKALTKLQSGGAVEFTVKYDEENIRQVTVANALASGVAQPAPQEVRPSPEPILENIAFGASAVNQADTGVAKRRRLSARSVVFGLNLFAAGLIVGLVIMALGDGTPG
ncbi:hypothetical protein [Neorhizobium galegae]|uniref:hypothetical protein n=1 Tax=Neorhizobium galegae TaxID=399 RepID=UPI00062220DA|nr:hypothetical protein [Neorhizobium galegae]CDZ29104.1 Hypothetical protein NGAL_HAMBI490_39660 [Neorhizobium galegae bv. officinalis]KAA9384003.1 hypothetical protein F4V88_27480 [Neorhizobium galegae]MCM2498639.1 hypothetical protein [Neorhizobium galegae]MCQ1775625.1 hypothetical protein [Neorhizobium galegae]MCQ1798107.1 hypothetical protein [Neorhizobium galegae]